MELNKDSEITEDTKDFLELFQPKASDEVVPWIGREAVGISVLRDYPENYAFVPAKTRSGRKDSVALIKVGYFPEKAQGKEVNLFVSASKTSRYLSSGRFDYDFTAKDSPTKESLEESKKSRQPFPLEEVSRFIFNFETKNFLDGQKNKKVTLNEIVDYIYTFHLKTAKTFGGMFFRIKFHSHEKLVHLLGLLIDFLMGVNSFVFGRQIREQKAFLVGWHKPYSHKDLVTLSPERFSLGGITFPVSTRVGLLFSLIVLTLFSIKYFSRTDLFLIAPLESGSEIIRFSYLVIAFWILDVILPHTILLIINTLIRVRWWLIFRVKIAI